MEHANLIVERFLFDSKEYGEENIKRIKQKARKTAAKLEWKDWTEVEIYDVPKSCYWAFRLPDSDIPTNCQEALAKASRADSELGLYQITLRKKR